MVLLLLAACDADKGSGDDSGCPSGETLVDGECVEASDDTGPPSDDTGTPEVHARWVSAGTSHTCLLLDGVVTCWGKNDGGELDVPDKGLFLSVDAADHTCGLLAAVGGDGACWGPEDYGENFVVGDNYLQITTGNDHGCGVTAMGAVCWGSNLQGQASTPPDGMITGLDAGAFHTCGIHEHGQVECWGGSDADPAGGVVFTAVSAGGSSSCGITSEQAVRCWGEDKGVTEGFPTGSFVQVSVGGSHACALDAAGGVQCWGDDSEGQTDVTGGTYEQVSAGTAHTCALTMAGEVVCWGSNADGQADPP